MTLVIHVVINANSTALLIILNEINVFNKIMRF